jgi:hypothetical protein
MPGRGAGSCVHVLFLLIPDLLLSVKRLVGEGTCSVFAPMLSVALFAAFVPARHPVCAGPAKSRR